MKKCLNCPEMFKEKRKGQKFHSHRCAVEYNKKHSPFNMYFVKDDWRKA